MTDPVYAYLIATCIPDSRPQDLQIDPATLCEADLARVLPLTLATGVTFHRQPAEIEPDAIRVLLLVASGNDWDNAVDNGLRYLRWQCKTRAVTSAWRRLLELTEAS